MRTLWYCGPLICIMVPFKASNIVLSNKYTVRLGGDISLIRNQRNVLNLQISSMRANCIADLVGNAPNVIRIALLKAKHYNVICWVHSEREGISREL